MVSRRCGISSRGFRAGRLQDEVYGEASLGKDAGCDETSTLEPTNPYSAAKAGAEMMVRSYMTSYKMPCIVTRGNNVYGPHQVRARRHA